jgi:hypothetical protein
MGTLAPDNTRLIRPLERAVTSLAETARTFGADQIHDESNERYISADVYRTWLAGEPLEPLSGPSHRVRRWWGRSRRNVGL